MADDITVNEIITLVGPCLGKYSQQLVTLMREGEDGFTGQAMPRMLTAFANSRLPEQARQNINQCPERFAAAVLTVMGHPVTPQEIEAESAEVQKRLRWHLKKG